jgi:hypothetical protein
MFNPKRYEPGRTLFAVDHKVVDVARPAHTGRRFPIWNRETR